ncbi:MAG: VWA domain-containing protein [Ignavibacteria bacterium]|nr:VWA domain-containing protein [Ignavibacteria bacterium]
MTFLNPLVLFGLIAASIPIIIHLLNLRKLKVIEFSSLQFLKEMQKNKMRKIKIKQILLLILRTLVIIFLVLSFARPTIRNVKIAGLGSEVKNTIILVIDDTPSMSVEDKKGTYISQAKKIAEKILEMTEEGDEIYLLKFSELSVLKEDFNPLSKNLVLNEIENIEVKDVSKTFIDVFISLSKILEKTTNLSKEIYILTDFQKTNLSDNLSELPKLDKSFDANTRIYIFKIGEKDAFNISIDSLQVLTRIFEINKPVSISATLNNYSSEKGINVSTNLYFNDRKAAQKGIDLNSNASGNFTFTGQIKEYGFNSGKLEIEEDDFLKDNVRFFNFYVPEKIKVLMVSENQNDLLFINLVLSQTLDDNSEPIFYITQSSTQFFNSYKLENYDIIILSSPEKIFNLNSLKNYILNGGKILILPGINSSALAFSKAIETLGLNPIDGVTGSKENKSSFTRFKEIDFNHPIFSGIFAESTPKKIESPKIFMSFNYKPTLNGKEIITLENNYSFLVEEKIGQGVVLLFTSAMDLNWNELPLKPIFVPLINRIALYANSNGTNLNFIAGDDVQFKPFKRITDQLRVQAPDGKEMIFSSENLVKNVVSIGELENAGNYKIFEGDKLIGMISVNINSRESNLTKLKDDEFEKFAKLSFPSSRFRILNLEVNPQEIIAQERYGTELWKLFLILAIICLVIEMIIARASKNDLKNIEPIKI